ncbi:MAG: hypothetical protein HGA82_03660, partial [Anaerolineales bacterium]|nr:hypothetical protein [Anaerolineales bacterium]
ADQYYISADIWSATSYKALRNDALNAQRWNMLHPTEPPRSSYVEQVLKAEKGPFIAVSDYMKLVPDQIAPWVPGGLLTLGTDGFGRSDTRAALRRFFEIDAEHVVIATLSALASKGTLKKQVVADALKQRYNVSFGPGVVSEGDKFDEATAKEEVTDIEDCKFSRHGVLHFSDKPPADGNADQVQLRPTNSFPGSMPGEATPTTAVQAKRPVKARSVVMFSAEWCGYCRKARQYFQANRVAFRERDVDKDPAARREYERLGGSGLPLILVGDQRLSGFSEDGFRRLYGH